MTLTAQHYQICDHEARHVAAATILGATVYVVSREGKGDVHGQVLFKAKTVRDRQAILLAPLVHAFNDSPDFPLGSYAVDIIEAARNAPLLAGIEAAREVVKRPDYQELARRISRRLITQPVIGPEELSELRSQRV
jgi:hypothetical protein